MSGYEQPPYSVPAGQDTASYEGSEARPAETTGPTAIYRDEAGNEYNLPVVDARPDPSSSLRQTFADQGSGRLEPAQQQQQNAQGLPALPGLHDSRGYAAAPYYWSADRQHQQHYMRGQPSAAQAAEHHEHMQQQQQQQLHQHASSAAYAQHYHDQQQHQQEQHQQQHSQQSAPPSPERRHAQMDSGFVSEGGYLPPGQPAIWSGAHCPAQQQQAVGPHHGQPGTPYSSHPPTAHHTPVAEREQDYASQQEYASPQHSAVASSYARQDPRSPGLPNPGGPPQSPYARTTRST